MYAWGSNVNGQLGLQSGEVVKKMSHSHCNVYSVEKERNNNMIVIVFILTFNIDRFPNVLRNSKVVAIATGDEFSLAEVKGRGLNVGQILSIRLWYQIPTLNKNSKVIILTINKFLQV